MEVGQGGKVSALDEIHEKYGFEGKSIVTMAEVTEYLYNLSLIHIFRNNIECLFILILFVSKLLSYLIQRLCVNRCLLYTSRCV